MMKDVEFSCMQKVIAEDIFWREIFFGGKISSCATQYLAFFLTKTIDAIQLEVQSRREDRLKNR